MEKYTVIIGLEVHAQLQTESKIYNGDSSRFGDKPNTNLGVITLAHPGTLPKLNKRVVEYAVKMGLACQSSISRTQIFDRKNYFYPDLPKGYQITQDRTPICVGGIITITTKTGTRNISLNRIHIEEDAGKSIHTEDGPDTLVDFNRSGTPLVEIVTNPELHTSEEAYELLVEIRKLVRYLDICDGNMEEGSLRCDANISLMPAGSSALGKKVEVKNMNSIRNVQRAIDHEVERQRAILEGGGKVVSETRLFNAADGKTYSMREKEELNDYRYFPDPDLSPLIISEKWLDEIKAAMPVLPAALRSKLVAEYRLPEYDAGVLTDVKEIALYFLEAMRYTKHGKAVSNWIMGPVKAWLNESNLSILDFPLSAEGLSALVDLVESGSVSFAAASQKLLPALIAEPSGKPEEIATRLNLIQESNAGAILPIVNDVIREFPLKVEEFKNGKKGIVTMFMGEVMKRTKGKADPKVAAKLVEEKLSEQ